MNFLQQREIPLFLNSKFHFMRHYSHSTTYVRLISRSR